ncbi:FeoA family protein [Halocella sp. SP3-1]|uniref:FeoA family protein n=1 Tax=Halocella sp. SP3-1 TaxID=2382161 RepID=UPI000F76484D|nr:FeoA family protein [Halocella sp. SP3-1]AZO95993.1 ferrous iron transport protein A [Halocella sp. SP3-1]
MISQIGVISLAKLKQGERARVVYTKEYDRGFVQHLSDMGLIDGSEIEIIAPGNPGPFLIEVKDTSLAIGQGIAKRILVEKNI